MDSILNKFNSISEIQHSDAAPFATCNEIAHFIGLITKQKKFIYNKRNALESICTQYLHLIGQHVADLVSGELETSDVGFQVCRIKFPSGVSVRFEWFAYRKATSFKVVIDPSTAPDLRSFSKSPCLTSKELNGAGFSMSRRDIHKTIKEIENFIVPAIKKQEEHEQEMKSSYNSQVETLTKQLKEVARILADTTTISSLKAKQILNDSDGGSFELFKVDRKLFGEDLSVSVFYDRPMFNLEVVAASNSNVSSHVFMSLVDSERYKAGKNHSGKLSQKVRLDDIESVICALCKITQDPLTN